MKTDCVIIQSYNVIRVQYVYHAMLNLLHQRLHCGSEGPVLKLLAILPLPMIFSMATTIRLVVVVIVVVAVNVVVIKVVVIVDVAVNVVVVALSALASSWFILFQVLIGK